MRQHLSTVAIGTMVVIAVASAWYATAHGDAPAARKPKWAYRVLSGPELAALADKHRNDAEKLLEEQKKALDTPGLKADNKFEDCRRQVALNALGKEGWELCAISAEDKDHLRYVFKRAE